MVGLVAGLILVPVLTRTIADPDLWGHLRFGLDMLETWTLPADDPYSFTQDIPWTNHEWLSELIMAVAYKAAGTVGLVLLKGVLVAALMTIVIVEYAGTPLVIRSGALLMTVWATASITPTLRPQLWTLLGVAVLCRTLMRVPRRQWLLGLPLLFMFWVNLHGGWIVGAGLLAVWTLTQMFRPAAPRALVVGTAAASALATLVNPYGWHMWAFLADTVRLSRDISEWQPLFSFPVWDWLPWLVTMALVMVSVFSRHKPPVARLAMIALLAYASIRVVRIAPLCVIAAVLLLRSTAATWITTRATAFTPLTQNAARGLAVAVVSGTLVSGIFVLQAATCIPLEGEWTPDRTAGATLAQSNLSGKIVTWFGWGQYAIWHLAPGLRVSMDGRRETVYSDKLLADHSALYRAAPEGMAFFTRLDPDYVWLPNSHAALRDWLISAGYRVDVQTPESFIAVRADRPRLYARPASTDRCFPAP
jgi:hypothetical protein